MSSALGLGGMELDIFFFLLLGIPDVQSCSLLPPSLSPPFPPSLSPFPFFPLSFPFFSLLVSWIDLIISLLCLTLCLLYYISGLETDGLKRSGRSLCKAAPLAWGQQGVSYPGLGVLAMAWEVSGGFLSLPDPGLQQTSSP